MAPLLRLAARSARARLRGLLLTALVLALATASTSVLITLSAGSPDLSGRAALAFGPNLVVEPKAVQREASAGGLIDPAAAAPATFPEASLARLGAVRHASRLTAVQAVLEGTARLEPPMEGHVMPDVVPVLGVWFTDHASEVGLASAATRAEDVFTWWQVEGRFPGAGGGGALVGRRAAASLMVSRGDGLSLGSADGSATASFVVTGILTTGDADEDRVVLDLGAAQALLGEPGQVSRAYLSAAVVPDDALARQDPDTMSDREYQEWYCTPYLGSVARQVGEAVAGAQARPLLQVARVNGEVEQRLGAFAAAMVLVVGAASAAAVSAATAARQLDRERESALLEALGATRSFALRLALAENLLAAALGGAAGAVASLLVSGAVTTLAFGVALPPSPLPAAAAFALAVGCAALGTGAAFLRLARRPLSAALGGS